MKKLSKDEEKGLAKWRAENEVLWERDITKAAHLEISPTISQGDAADYRQQLREMRALMAAGATYEEHKHKFGYVRNRCLCDQQWTHPHCRYCK